MKSGVMKKLIFVFFIFIFKAQTACTQDITALEGNFKIYKAWIYYTEEKERQPKLYMQWQKGVIHGKCRSWYPNGNLESEREMCENKKNGIASAWYEDGSLMFIEEYHCDILQSGSYYGDHFLFNFFPYRSSKCVTHARKKR